MLVLAGAAVGRVHEVLLRVRVAGLNEVDVVDLRLNSRLLPQMAESGHRKINEMYKMTARSYRVMGYWLLWRLPLDGGVRAHANPPSLMTPGTFLTACPEFLLN